MLAASLAVSVSGCGGSEAEPKQGGAPTARTATEAGGIDPLEGAGTGPVKGSRSGAATALLERVALARHEGFDRVVLQFTNGLPGYSVAYAEPPLYEDGSGAPVRIAGREFLVIRLEPASGFDLETGEGRLVYTGPRRLGGSAAGTSVVREVVRTGDFEAVLTWAVGLGDRVDFRVLTLDGPPRLVVDLRNH